MIYARVLTKLSCLEVTLDGLVTEDCIVEEPDASNEWIRHLDDMFLPVW